MNEIIIALKWFFITAGVSTIIVVGVAMLNVYHNNKKN